MESIKKKARITGWLYLLLTLTGIYSIMYVPSALIVTGDATATANNIKASKLLFRTGIVSELASAVIFVFLVLALYHLLKEVSQKHAALMVTWVVIASSIGFLNTLNYLGTSIALSGADFLSVFEKPQLDALAYFFIRLHGHAIQAIQVFWGLWLFPFGLLVYRSRFIPKIMGALLWIAGSAYVLDTFMFFLFPQYKATLSSLFMLLEMGELPLMLWLLIVGAKVQPSGAPAS
jgi:hypothetical protein